MSEAVTLQFPGFPPIKGVGPVVVAQEAHAGKHRGGGGPVDGV